MKVLYIQALNEKTPLAHVTSNLDGTFNVDSPNQDTKTYFENLLTSISKENPTLPLIGGKSEENNGKIVEKTVQKQVDIKSEEYLNALWDYFTRMPQEYNGQRIRAFVSDTGKSDTILMDHTVEETLNNRKKILTENLQKLIQQNLYTLYLNIPNFPKLTKEDYEKVKIVAQYFLVGDFVTDKSRTKREIVKQKMSEENLVFDPQKHILIYSPLKPGWVGAPSILVVEIPLPIS